MTRILNTRHRGDTATQTMRRTHVTASQQADMYSCSPAVQSLGKSKKQASVALSTTEVEYYAVGITFQEATWIKQICQELNVSIDEPIRIYTDNTGAVALTDNPIFHNRSKHIDIRWHFVRDLIHARTICTSHIPRTQNGADFLTKALNHFEHEQCVKLLGME